MELPADKDERLKWYRAALAKWETTGYILFIGLAEEWLRVNRPRNSPVRAAKEIARLLHAHVIAEGAIHEVAETRPEWNCHPFHYDLRVLLDGRLTYFETRLVNDRGEPVIYVVNIHDA